ncbi:hypothetical protein A2853_03455 [Candidatus Kaiserbacteria bacterium RIFCSPHIGHO2_01_FULL_55_17]|uniref:Four helix bundle protein n=1 Tax=Candidatus Kaiserbacteria bacterium RIFCSPHIGHO2_01_FULL_55_17 TaxID=1798484 RepID=A0A1F6D9A0_9BACT|nr:MAG: hypothetical protein A2853_03455 [Candidatus Kaiserbacteria bacterium RIFCSPHIGHO2_01_FULL_55_17]
METTTQAKSHRDLIVWQKSMLLCKEIYKLTETFPQREIYALSSQMRRASVSIPSNIAEGRSRASKKDYAHFLQMAYGSSSELETQLMISKDLSFCDDVAYQKIQALNTEIAKMLHVMIYKLNGASRS